MTDEIIQPKIPPSCPRCTLKTRGGRPFCERCSFDLAYGTVKRSARGTCIYCQVTGDLSEEHIYPNWFASHFPKRHTYTTHAVTRPAKLAPWENVPLFQAREVKKIHPYARTVRNVCEGCNNGWMSKLQQQAKRTILELAAGKDRRLRVKDVKVLSRWAAMVLINFESHGRILSATLWQRQQLMNGQMPDGFRISYAFSEDESWAGRDFTRVACSLIQITPGVPLQFTSSYFCIEKVAFHVFRCIGRNTLKEVLIGAGLADAELPTRQLWPDYNPNERSPPKIAHDDLVAIQALLGPVLSA